MLALTFRWNIFFCFLSMTENHLRTEMCVCAWGPNVQWSYHIPNTKSGYIKMAMVPYHTHWFMFAIHLHCWCCTRIGLIIGKHINKRNQSGMLFALDSIFKSIYRSLHSIDSFHIWTHSSHYRLLHYLDMVASSGFIPMSFPLVFYSISRKKNERKIS